MLTGTPPEGKAPAPAVQAEESTITVNIFRNVHATLPSETRQVTPAAIAQRMRDEPKYVDRKEAAPLVTLVTYKSGAFSRKIADIEAANAINGDWDKNFNQDMFELGMAELHANGAQVIAYQTYNSTPAAPRWRIFVLLDAPIPPADYRTYWVGLNDLFGGFLDDNAKDCSRLNYWPSCPVGQTREFRTLNVEVA